MKDNEMTLLEKQLIDAVRLGDHDTVKTLIDKQVDVNTGVGPYGTTPLHWAAHAGNRDIIDLLVKTGADFEKLDEDGYSPLYWAVDNQSIAGVESLLEYFGCEVDGDSWLLALEKQNVALLECLVDGEYANLADEQGRVPLYFVLTTYPADKKIAALKTLLTAGARSNVKIGDKALIGKAFELNEVEAIKLLLLHGATLSLTSLDTMATAGRLEIIQYLLDKKIPLVANEEGNSWLHQAAQNDNVVLIELLLSQTDSSININATNKAGCTPLWLAASQGNVAAVKCLLSKKADVNITGPNKETVLQVAVRTHAAMSLIECLIAAGVDVNAKDVNGDTFLHKVVRNGHAGDWITILQQQPNFDLDAQNYQNQTPLHMAFDYLRRGQSERNTSLDNPLIHYLIKNGDVDLLNNSSQTALQKAAAATNPCCNEAMMLALMEKTKLINHQDSDGNTALHYIMGHKKDGSIDATHFLQYGADLNMQNKEGDTPAHLAVKRVDGDALLKLEVAGANMNIKNNKGLYFNECKVYQRSPFPPEFNYCFREDWEYAYTREMADNIAKAVKDARQQCEQAEQAQRERYAAIKKATRCGQVEPPLLLSQPKFAALSSVNPPVSAFKSSFPENEQSKYQAESPSSLVKMKK